MAVVMYPPRGTNVNVVLTTSTHVVGYWDGTTWWVGLNGSPDDVPIVPSYVDSWTPIS